MAAVEPEQEELHMTLNRLFAGVYVPSFQEQE
jgi:hypothetical protein